MCSGRKRVSDPLWMNIIWINIIWINIDSHSCSYTKATDKAMYYLFVCWISNLCHQVVKPILIPSNEQFRANWEGGLQLPSIKQQTSKFGNVLATAIWTWCVFKEKTRHKNVECASLHGPKQYLLHYFVFLQSFLILELSLSISIRWCLLAALMTVGWGQTW